MKTKIAHFLIFVQGTFYTKIVKSCEKIVKCSKCSGLLLLIPGLIHSYHPDGGAKTIADFTNYEKCQQEILWYFRLLGK